MIDDIFVALSLLWLQPAGVLIAYTTKVEDYSVLGNVMTNVFGKGRNVMGSPTQATLHCVNLAASYWSSVR